MTPRPASPSLKTTSKPFPDRPRRLAFLKTTLHRRKNSTKKALEAALPATTNCPLTSNATSIKTTKNSGTIWTVESSRWRVWNRVREATSTMIPEKWKRTKKNANKVTAATTAITATTKTTNSTKIRRNKEVDCSLLKLPIWDFPPRTKFPKRKKKLKSQWPNNKTNSKTSMTKLFKKSRKNWPKK